MIAGTPGVAAAVVVRSKVWSADKGIRYLLMKCSG